MTTSWLPLALHILTPLPTDWDAPCTDPCERCGQRGTLWAGPYDARWLCADCAYFAQPSNERDL